MGGNDLLAFVEGRRSTRIFEDRPVPMEALERMVATAIQAPTACNRQLWHFVIITDPAARIRACALSDAQQSYLEDAPALIALFYDTTLESRNPCSTAQISMGMATYGLLLAAEAEGLGAIYLGGIRRPRGIAEAVGAPPWMQNFGVVCVGCRGDDPPAPDAREARDVISLDSFGARPKRFHADIRPHLWKLEQYADFRDKLLWYKGVSIDARTLHVDPDPRFSEKFRYMIGRLGMMIARRERPVVLDVLSCNGDLVLSLLQAFGEEVSRIYAYDLTPGIGRYLDARLGLYRRWPAFGYLENAAPGEIRIPLGDETVDVMSCYERVDQFHDAAPLLREMRRVLRPGGEALVVVSGRFYPHLYRYGRMRKKNYALGRNWNRGPERKLEPSEMAALFARAGFAVRSMRGLQPVERRLLEAGARLARKIGLGAWAGRLEERASQRFVAAGAGREFSGSLIYEVTRE